MKRIFPVFSNHLQLAHTWWQKLLKQGDTVLDATCGQGYDTLALARLVLTAERGAVWALDIQPQALKTTQQRLETALAPELMARIKVLKHDHSTLPQALITTPLALAVYNLGYLPGSDKTLTTVSSSTLSSVEVVSACIQPGGAISIMCYTGHDEGSRECDVLLAWASQLPPSWNVCCHRWLNACRAPVWLFIQKALERDT